MLEENKNLKDGQKDSIKDTTAMPAPLVPLWRDGSGLYTKINKLITALYMVTDIMDREEPLRNKLRTLGVEILSDTFTKVQARPGHMSKCLFDIDELLSLLDIASAVNMISEMNCNILKKEFSKLKQSITQDNPVWLEEFFGRENSIGHDKQTGAKIGVQRGGTLMKALSDKIPSLSGSKLAHVSKNNFDALKKQRRDLILKTIKDKPNGISIKDIMLALRNLSEECGEKTLQRELVSMVNDGVLKKSGEKRWSRYSIRN